VLLVLQAARQLRAHLTWLMENLQNAWRATVGRRHL